MIGHLSGKIIKANEKEVILSASGVGYRVFCPLPTLLACTVGKEKDLYIHTRVREDAIALYGFETEVEMETFEKLLDVPGVGPKSGLAMLSVNSPSSIANAIEGGDVQALSHTPGIGKKSAEKIIVELRGKLTHLQNSTSNENTFEVRLALEALGYTPREINEVLSKLTIEKKSTNTLIKEALAQLK